ncbi:hypothetical protein JMJ77_0008094 [Colletotrichum scovillei]|uniref:Uncharacterized protein n=1 Tax=Colletotrichum scovillei TaxID=1209932 RepID=A0A9P7RE39_9PEZI|nr:hypothetical protein JMJ77_0008094 [Colletotrichum scovillei]KAG7075056.1 hypothetical protein JMJ76_0011519 [Colletotrichum scovillei]KAG7082122.1 hypothetical protein JMJ78_0004227 [Colletotrichum scovillei]
MAPVSDGMPRKRPSSQSAVFCEVTRNLSHTPTTPKPYLRIFVGCATSPPSISTSRDSGWRSYVGIAAR